MKIFVNLLNLGNVDHGADRRCAICGDGRGKYARHGIRIVESIQRCAQPKGTAAKSVVKAVAGRCASERLGCLCIFKPGAVELGFAVYLHHAVLIQHQDAAGVICAKLKRRLIHRIDVAAGQRSAHLFGKGICGALILLHTLGKQIFAHQLKQRNAHHREGDDDDQQIGDQNFPAYGI